MAIFGSAKWPEFLETILKEENQGFKYTMILKR